MSNAAVLEAPVIEDALFGEPKVLQAEGDFDPDGGCFCVCSCRILETKTPNADNRMVDSSATK